MIELAHVFFSYLGHHVVGTTITVVVALGLLIWLIAALREHPTGFWFIFWGELAERASYYGMRAILALYMVQVLGFKQGNAASTISFFISACYFMPLLGGIIADRWLGRYKTILYFSGPYILGHVILGGYQNTTGLFVALALLALGSGSIKPNTTTLMGAMYEKEKKEHLMSKAFTYFYAAINVGSTIAFAGLPAIRNTIFSIDSSHGVAKAAALSHAYGVALTVPAVLMAAAFLFFGIGKKFYPKENVRERPPKTEAQRAAEWLTLKRIAGIFALVAVFWFCYDEQGSTWIYFANDHMDLTLWGTHSVTADQIGALNPFLIVFFTPFFNWLWDFLKARRGGSPVPDTRKMVVGFFIVAACMGTMCFAGFASETHKVSVWWMAMAVFIITVAELCVSVVGLELAFKVAVPGTKSFVTACFLFTVFGGDFVGGFFNKLWGKISPGAFFGLQTLIILMAAFAFIWVARNFEREHKHPSEAPAMQQAAGA